MDLKPGKFRKPEASDSKDGAVSFFYNLPSVLLLGDTTFLVKWSVFFVVSPCHVAPIPSAVHISLPAKRAYTEVEAERKEAQLNSKQRKYLRFQKHLEKKC